MLERVADVVAAQQLQRLVEESCGDRRRAGSPATSRAVSRRKATQKRPKLSVVESAIEAIFQPIPKGAPMVPRPPKPGRERAAAE